MPGYRIRKRRYARRKNYRRKRASKKMRRMRNYTKADGGHLEKITINLPVVVDGTGTFAQATMNWMATGATGFNEVFFTGGAANANVQFVQCQTMYREYWVSSAKFEYRPVKIDGGANSYTLSPILCGTGMDRLNLTPIVTTEFRAALDFKLYDPTKGFKRFYRVAKYANSKLIKWRSTNDATNGPNGGFNSLPNCQTTMHMPCTGLAAGFHVADVEVTYYIKFRGRQRA